MEAQFVSQRKSGTSGERDAKSSVVVVVEEREAEAEATWGADVILAY